MTKNLNVLPVVHFVTFDQMRRLRASNSAYRHYVNNYFNRKTLVEGISKLLSTAISKLF